MARGPLVTDKVEALIAEVYQRHPKWKAPEVRNEVSFLLRKDNPRLLAEWPSLSSIQKVLANVRKKKELPPDPQEKPWSLGTLDQHPIPPEAVWLVLKLWKHRITRQREAQALVVADMKDRKWEEKADFTIREAKWAARLSTLCKNMTALSFMASLYASTEQAYQLINRPFNSAVLDNLLMDVKTGKAKVTPDGSGYTRPGESIREKYSHISREESEKEAIRIREERRNLKKEAKQK